MDDKHARDLLAQLKLLVKAQTRIAAALERANANDPLAMIQEALGGEQPRTVPVREPCDRCGKVIPSEDYPLCPYCAHVQIRPGSPEEESLRHHEQWLAERNGTRGAAIPPEEQWRLG